MIDIKPFCFRRSPDNSTPIMEDKLDQQSNGQPASQASTVSSQQPVQNEKSPTLPQDSQEKAYCSNDGKLYPTKTSVTPMKELGKFHTM